tara:strand:- start:41 stop:415 length:375 start_codon:yes stop_codon:yes gene_type:complete
MSKKFNSWFHSYLLHKTASSLDRDILRWAKPVLKYGYDLQCLTDLEFKGSQRFIDLEIDSNRISQLESQVKAIESKLQQRDELLVEAVKEIDKFENLYPTTIKTTGAAFLKKPEIKELLERKGK